MFSYLGRELETLRKRLADPKRDPAAAGDAAGIQAALLELRSRLRDLRRETECWSVVVERPFFSDDQSPDVTRLHLRALGIGPDNGVSMTAWRTGDQPGFDSTLRRTE